MFFGFIRNFYVIFILEIESLFGDFRIILINLGVKIKLNVYFIRL